ncbi:MAG: CDP-alcohol phosphatidyltransferase family protein [Candidatus Hydrogenedentes bacterium]|nr:CDP-alcohol phosphatidyltransferase family protein [Candidatus Hydrogenedentota bacterium]
METKIDCYSAGERSFMAAGQRLRARLLSPFLKTLTLARVAPDHLTLLSFVAGLLFCPAWFWSLPLAWMCLAFHVILDGMDGPLARHLGVASNKGSFTDSMSDQAVITVTTVTLMIDGVAGVLPGVVYIAAYTTVVLFAFLRNVLEAPYAWLIRPRFYVYAWFLVEMYWLPDTLDYVLWLASGLLLLKVVSGFVGIRRRL